MITVEKLEEIDVPTAIRNIQVGMKQTLQYLESETRSQARHRAVDSTDYARYVARE